MIETLRQYAVDPLAFLCDLTGPDRLAEFQRETFAALAPSMLAIATGDKPPIGRYWIERTKGSSKTSDLGLVLTWLLAFSRRPLLLQVGAADSDQAAEERKAIVELLHVHSWLADRLKVQNWEISCDATGAVCEILAADVAGSHGARPDVVILDELAHVTKQEFCENLLDNAAKVPNGLVVVATNAGFLDSWQYRWRELARTSDRWVFHQHTDPAPWLDPMDIQEASDRNSKSRFMRLWRGVWAGGTGDALDESDVLAAIDHKLGPMTNPTSQFAFVAGLDLSTRRDRSALVTIGLELATQRIVLADVQAWSPGVDGKVDLPGIQDAIRYANWKFNLSAVCFDPYQAELMAQQLTRDGVNMIEVPFVGKNLNLMATTLLQSFRERKIAIYNDPELIRDLSRLSIVETPFGYKLQAPRDKSGHCDRATALAIALPWACEALSTHDMGDVIEFITPDQLPNMDF